MRIKRTAIFTLALASLVMGSLSLLTGCEGDTTTVLPTTPEPPVVCIKPVPSGIVTEDRVNFRATYSDTTESAGWRQWSFDGGEPPTSGAQTGSVSFPRVTGVTYSWTLRVCKSAPTGGPDDCCETTGGTVNF